MVVNAEQKRELEIDPEKIGDFVFQAGVMTESLKWVFLRTSLDELPQLFNVLIGNMSLIGPRPEIPDVVKFHPKEYEQRLLVSPGIMAWLKLVAVEKLNWRKLLSMI